jgi:hypothetical protein
VISFNCPNCGAPLQLNSPQNLAVCLYCDSTLRLQANPAAPAVSVETTLPAEHMEQLKQLLLAGQPEQAIQLYQQQTNANLAEAQETIADLGRQISFKTVLHQPLNTFGLVLVGVCACILVLSIWGGLNGAMHPFVTLALVGYTFIQLFIIWPSLLKTVKFWRGKVAPATVLKLALIGVSKIRRTEVHTFKVLVEVQPQLELAFRAEMFVPVRAKSLERFHVGTVFTIKYLPGDPPELIFYQAVD